MKKTLFFLLPLSGIFVCSYAQPTMNFESWTQMNNGTLAVPEEPTGWITGNQLVSFFSPGNSQSVFKVSGSEAHGGQYAMKIVTTDVVNDPSSGQMPDPTGIAFAGKVQFSPLKLINGFPYTSRPTTCEFWYKYSPQTGDSASCGVALTRWNGTAADTIAAGGFIIKNAAASYTQATFVLTYNPVFSTLFPDTMILGFSATCITSNTCGVVNSTLWVDDLMFSGSNGIGEYLSSHGVILYPNPAGDFVNIFADVDDAVAVNIHDAAGRSVAASSLSEQGNTFSGKSATINILHLAPGVYSYAVVNASGSPIRSGRFGVIR